MRLLAEREERGLFAAFSGLFLTLLLLLALLSCTTAALSTVPEIATAVAEKIKTLPAADVNKDAKFSWGELLAWLVGFGVPATVAGVGVAKASGAQAQAKKAQSDTDDLYDATHTANAASPIVVAPTGVTPAVIAPVRPT